MITFNQLADLLRRIILTGLLASFIWLPGLFSADAAFAMPKNREVKGDRLGALVSCLPSKQLSQPNWARAWDEMGNDQLQRVFNLTASPKLSPAEIAIAQCMSQKGFPAINQTPNS